MQKYTTPEVEIIQFQTEDIITTSTMDEVDDKLNGMSVYGLADFWEETPIR